MSAIPVAIESMVKITDGNVLYPPAVSGSWSHSPPTISKVSYLSYDKNLVVYEVSCNFSFSGLDSAGNPVSGSSSVTLSPNPTVLTENKQDLLVEGDKNFDSYNNTIEIDSGQDVLRTAKK